MDQLITEHPEVVNLVKQYYSTLTDIMTNIAQFCNKGDSFTINTLTGSITFKVK